MDYKVIFKNSFLEDLEQIVRLIAAHSPTAARTLGECIIETSESLGFFPERYARVRQRPSIRRFVIKRHFKVFYRVQHASRTVEILRCWDGRSENDPVA